MFNVILCNTLYIVKFGSYFPIHTCTCSTVQSMCEGVRGVVREEVEGALQSYASAVRPEDQSRENRARTLVGNMYMYM